MPTRKRSQSKPRGSSGTPKTASRKKSGSTGAPTRMKGTSRTRAAKKGEGTMVQAGKRGIKRDSVIDAESENEVYGAQMSERARRGESTPAMPEKKTRNTRSLEAKSVPRTGIAKRRKAPR